MNNESEKPFRTSSLIFSLTLIAALLMCVVYAYLFDVIKKTGEGNASLERETVTLEGQASQVGELKRSLAVIQERRPVLVSYFIDATDIVPFLETIEGYGRQTNVTTKFNTFTFKKSPDMLAVSMVADGSFTDLYHFMALLEAAPYEINMTNVDVQAQIPKGLDPATVKNSAPAVWEANISMAVTSITGVPKDAVKATK